MISVLDMLRSRLGGGGQSDRVMEEMLRGNLLPAPSEADRRLQAMGPNLPEYLPGQVWDSLLNKPSYGEGEIMAPAEFYNKAEGGPLMQSGPQREDRLAYDRQQALLIPNPYVTEDQEPRSWALPEGDVWSSRPRGQSPFASPLNQLMQLGRRAPLSLY